ncbi:MAG: bifunctional adenosylcobinamide kinase/adenosylcobinamide-phosphate guanylyltransferase [Campylobacterota bacterium]|nr:bifunctional adenosylcobinamide kinase/adenosylcobinamide-phosphate guanylyltransferase [Campylobacterota bacterium]
MKTLFIGGIKSGKSHHAEIFSLTLGSELIYLATTDAFDEEMKERIDQHQQQRSTKFTTIEEPLKLYETLKQQKRPVLIECITLWINNMFYHNREAEILPELHKILSLKTDMIFVLNDVGTGIIPTNALARKFIDISGIVSQKIAQNCDEVYHCIAGLKQQIK